jgi:hypothetical protein
MKSVEVEESLSVMVWAWLLLSVWDL